MLRKFFDPAAGETKAENKYDFAGEVPFDEIFQQPKIDDTAEETKETVETKAEETKEVVEEKKEEVAVEEKKEVPAAPDWKEYVKNPQYRKEVHSLLDIDEDALNFSKKISQDEFVKKLVSYREQNGNLTPFIEAATLDYDKIPQESLILADLKKQYSHLSSDKQEKLAKADFNQRFVYKDDPNLDEAENREMAELTALKLENEGARIRTLRKSEQQQFLDSVKPVDFNAALEAKMQEKLQGDQKEFEDFKQSVEASPFLKSLYSDKKIVFGEKENSFNYTVNPDTIKEQTLDTNKFYSNFWDADGKFNFSKWAKVVAYANDIDGVENAKINHGRSLGTKQIVEGELENVKKETDQSVKQSPKKTLGRAVIEDSQPIEFGEMFGGVNGIK